MRFAHFFGNSAQGPDIVDLYRREFRPSAQLAERDLGDGVRVRDDDDLVPAGEAGGAVLGHAQSDCWQGSLSGVDSI